jgi:hypothetical protein
LIAGVLPRAALAFAAVEVESAKPLVPAHGSEAAPVVPSAAGASSLEDAPSAMTEKSEDGFQQYSAADLSNSRMEAARRKARFDAEAKRNTDCENGKASEVGESCRVSWSRVLGESFLFLSSQHGGNIWMDTDTRYNLTHGSFWGDYIYCIDHYRYSRWKDDDPFGVDYIGHPMMGAMTNSIYEQNDPKQRALMYENTRRYWMGRLRATAYSAVYSAQWKVGPLSEASIGNTGIGYYLRLRDGKITNETGMQDFFITPIGGLAWNVGEDAIDRFLFAHVRHAHPHNRPLLIVASFMTPLKSGANLLRFRSMYYRDADERTAAVVGRMVR